MEDQTFTEYDDPVFTGLDDPKPNPVIGTILKVAFCVFFVALGAYIFWPKGNSEVPSDTNVVAQNVQVSSPQTVSDQLDDPRLTDEDKHNLRAVIPAQRMLIENHPPGSQVRLVDPQRLEYLVITQDRIEVVRVASDLQTWTSEATVLIDETPWYNP